MVLVGVIALFVLSTMVWASPRTAPSTVPIDAQNTDRVDNHHAAASTASASTRANRVLWVQSNGKFSRKVLPWSQLSKRYLTDDRQETTKATVALGAVLSFINTAYGADVYGYSSTGIGVRAQSNDRLPLKVEGHQGSNLIEAWDTPANDFAEMMPLEGDSSDYEPGDLLVLSQSGWAQLSSSPNVTNILGAYSTKPAFLGGTSELEEEDDRIPVVIMGIVPVKATAENGAIVPGDLLTSSSIPGHATKASPAIVNDITFYLPGTILGKALEPLKGEQGLSWCW